LGDRRVFKKKLCKKGSLAFPLECIYI